MLKRLPGTMRAPSATLQPLATPQPRSHLPRLQQRHRRLQQQQQQQQQRPQQPHWPRPRRQRRREGGGEAAWGAKGGDSAGADGIFPEGSELSLA